MKLPHDLDSNMFDEQGGPLSARISLIVLDLGDEILIFSPV